jgi:hypothetical protein
METNRLADSDSRTHERISAARAELEQRIQSELELLDALKKVEVFFASASGRMTPVEARHLLLAAPDGKTRSGAESGPHAVNKTVRPATGLGWKEYVLAMLAEGPQSMREMVHQGAMAGKEPNRSSVYSAIKRMLGTREVVRMGRGRYALPKAKATPKKMGTHAKKGGAPDVRWTLHVPALLADGKARTRPEIFAALEVEHGALSKKRFGVMMPYLEKNGFVVRDAQGRYSPGKRQ